MRLLLGLLFAAGLSTAAFADRSADPAPVSSPTAQLLAVTLGQGGLVVFADACCKRCSKGKACGDSCISRSKSCHKGQGCACD